jgi:hypothetical protein
MQCIRNLLGVLAHACGTHSVDGTANAALASVAQGARYWLPRCPSHPAIPSDMPSVRGACGAAIAVGIAVLLPALARRLPGRERVSSVEIRKLLCFSLSRSTIRIGNGL